MLNYWYSSSLVLLITGTFFYPTTLAQTAPLLSSDPEINSTASELSSDLQGQVPSVSQFTDVQPTDWAFQALQALIDRYECIAGYPNRLFRGNQTLSRYEFAAGLSACLSRIRELLATAADNSVQQGDLETLRRLQTEFTTELATLRGRVDGLGMRTAALESQQFSTTTKLRGFVIAAANAGGFEGDRIIDISGNEITNSQPNATMLYRTSLFLDTSFNGTDLLRILIEAGSDGITDNTGGFLEDVFKET